MSSGNRYSAPTPLQATPQLASELLCWNFAARVLCGQETLDGQSPSQCFRDAGTFDCLVFGIWPLSTDPATSTIGYQALERLSGQVTGQNLDCHAGVAGHSRLANKARPPSGVDSHCSLSAAANQRGGLEAKGEPRRASGQVPEHGRPQDRAQGKEKAREDSWQGHLNFAGCPGPAREGRWGRDV
ncbi:hypothetical protein CPAR01_11166 [Colletotrichum paranaense]|uniref:Uncharacterized protein n=1 Tax=Colletotrichum paranaense TaxID=1914294 RepID=A0ABQ9SAV1_9PEZI|nr:uncharacterized protein CPAR01_11166 [Colletotrichum paranaense]KAK1531517.1 hypothetical protein CPAR01_11166 [Colletotrichum paranaense]